MINSISKEKWEEMGEFREACYRLGVDTTPVDRARLEKAYKAVYSAFLDKKLGNVIWVDSPKEAKELFLSMGVSESPSDFNMWGGFDIYWVSHLQFLMTIPNVQADSTKKGLLDTYSETMYGHIWWPRENTVIACERPAEIHTERFRLSNTNGPAVLYRDGFSLFFVDGVAVKEEYITNPNNITIQIIKGESNAETRRVLIKLYGFARYLKSTGARELDSMAGQKLFVMENNEKVLLCTDGSTDRLYELPVAATANNCKEAQESMSGMPFDAIIAES